MTNKELSSYIEHYAEKDKTKSAIMLTGEWGTGKSHYIKNELIPFLAENGGYKSILVSLYGLSSVSEISKSIYFEARLGVLNTKSEGVAAGKLGVTTVLKGVSSFFGIELGASEDTLQQLYESIDLSGKLIILEDIERTKIDLLELLGYVNSLVEQDGVKVLLVANEAEILRYEPEQNSIDDDASTNIFKDKSKKKEKVYTAETLEYLKTKEKTISDTIAFSGDFEEAIKQIIRSFKNGKLNCFADDAHVKAICRIMEDHKNYNLRTFIYACQKTADIYQGLAGKYSEDFLTCIFYGIIHFSIQVKTGEKVPWSGTDVFSLELGSSQYPLFRFCYDYMKYHVLKREMIPVAEEALEKLRLYDKRKTQGDPDIVKVSNYHRYPEKDLRVAVESIQSRLNDPTDISFYDYGVLAVYLLQVKHLYGFDVAEGKRLLVENLRGRGTEIDADSLFGLTVRGAEEPLQKEYDELRKAMTDVLKETEVIPGFHYLPEQAKLFSVQFHENQEYFETGKLAANLDIPRMIDMFLASAPDQMDDIRYGFMRTYRSANIGQFLSADKDALVQLRKGILEGTNTHELDRVQRLQCEWFADNLLEIIEKLA